MPTTELLGAKQVGAVTGEVFTVKSAGAGKGIILTPLASNAKAGTVTHQVILKTAEVEGLTQAGAATKAAAGKAVTGQAVAAKTVAAKGVAPTLVEIEGAGKVVGAGAGKGGTAIQSIQLNGVLQNGAQGSQQVLLKGGEIKMTQGAMATQAAKAGAVKAGAVNKAGVAAAANTGKAAATVQAGTGSAAAGVATGGKAAGSGGTIWTGKGFSLGLGWGLGAWGPVLLAGGVAALGVGIYSYLKREQGGELEEVVG